MKITTRKTGMTGKVVALSIATLIGGGAIAPAVAMADDTAGHEQAVGDKIPKGTVAVGKGAAGIYVKKGPYNDTGHITDAKLDKKGRYLAEAPERYLDWATSVLDQAGDLYSDDSAWLYEEVSAKAEKPMVTLIEREEGDDEQSVTLWRSVAETSDGLIAQSLGENNKAFVKQAYQAGGGETLTNAIHYAWEQARDDDERAQVYASVVEWRANMVAIEKKALETERKSIQGTMRKSDDQGAVASLEQIEDRLDNIKRESQNFFTVGSADGKPYLTVGA